MKKKAVVRAPKYPFSIDISVESGEKIASLKSDAFKVKICQRSNNRMVEVLKIAGKLDNDRSTVDITLGKETYNFLHIERKK